MNIADAIHKLHEEFPFQGYTAGEEIYTNISRTIQRHLNPGARILDFGCGPCDKTAIGQYLGYLCSGYDDLQDDWHKISGNQEKIVRFASDCGIDFHLATEGSFPFEKESFDMIMLHSVIEHLHNSPCDLLNDLLELAKPDGLLFVTVPNAVNIRKRIDVVLGKTNMPPFEGYYWYPGDWRGHVREYVRGDLVALAQYLNLEILELRSCDQMLQKLPATIRPAYLFITHFFRGWKDSWTLVAKKKTDWKPRKELSRDELGNVLGTATSYQY